jgi:hypothetical protein
MTTPTSRRTEALKLRQTISQLLDQVFPIEHSMELFHRKGHRSELDRDRAADNFNDMRGHVDRLSEIIADARGKQRVTADVLPDKAA